MNILPRRSFRVLRNLLKSPYYDFRPFPFYYSLVKQDRFCGGSPNFKDVAEEKFEDCENSSHELFVNIDFDGIVGDNPEKKKTLQAIILELSMKIQTEPLLAPKQLTSEQWCILLDKETMWEREKCLKYWYAREMRKEAKAKFKQERFELLMQLPKKETRMRSPLSTDSPVVYSLQDTTLFDRIIPRHFLQKSNFDLALATMFGEDLLIDCGFEDYMNNREIHAAAQQISYFYSNNRVSNNPFNIILCNLKKDGKMMEALSRLLRDFEKDIYFITATEKDYCDIYPAEKLVYLTPHCNVDLEKYDADSVYIMAAYVDYRIRGPLSSVKAKKSGVRTARLPLDKYLNWSRGSKLLPFNVCGRVLGDLKNGSCWEYALRHLNFRKQKFQFLDNDINIKSEQYQAASQVREQAKRIMLYDMQIKNLYNRKKKDPRSEER